MLCGPLFHMFFDSSHLFQSAGGLGCIFAVDSGLQWWEAICYRKAVPHMPATVINIISPQKDGWLKYDFITL